MGHGPVGALVLQQLRSQAEYRLLLRARKPHRPGGHRLGPLGLPPKDQHRLAQGGRLLLEPAGIRKHEVAPGHEIVHLLHVQRLDEVDARMAGEVLPRRFPHYRGQVDGIDQLRLREGVRHPAQGGHDICHGRSVVLPAVAGHQQDAPAGIVQAVEQFV